MARRLFTLLSALSLLLFVAVCVLWVRSYRYADGADFARPGGLLLQTDSWRGELGVDTVVGWPAPEAQFRSYEPPIGLMPARPFIVPDTDQGDLKRWQAGVVSGARGRARTPLRDDGSVVRLSGYSINESQYHRLSNPMPYWSIGVPHWLLACITAYPPLVWIFRFLKTSVRRGRTARPSVRGLCRQCGYDLRATSGRCPECGTVPAAKHA